MTLSTYINQSVKIVLSGTLLHFSIPSLYQKEVELTIRQSEAVKLIQLSKASF